MGNSSAKAFDVVPYINKVAPYEAIVAGSTGASGRRIVESLVASNLCTKVIALTRREIPEEAYEKTFPDIDMQKAREKLVVTVVDFDNIVADPENTTSLPQIAPGTKAFSALGSSPYSEKVDLHYSNAFATAMQARGVTDMALVSATNANSKSYIGYPRTLGQRQDFFVARDFRALHVAMPWFIDREELATVRLKERIFFPMIPASLAFRVFAL
eukprot:GEMP01049390.1.p1 GENE.GEMP01049390.1~~GEMP01049390.1.p1  ORF type:complete len:214 (+),score=48.81 GEMP01049390.1:124-765(+)